MATDTGRGKYIPALSYHWLTPLFDPLMRLAAREGTFKRRLIAQARIKPGYSVLDLGCGTATLTIMIKRAQPEATVVGLDADPKVLALARRKVAAAGVDVTLDNGLAFALPYPEESFDCVVSSLVFHHLSRENKAQTLREVFRVLKPGGELHVADLGRPQNALMRLISLTVGRFEEASDNLKGFLPQMFRQACFEDVAETGGFMTVFGTLSLHRARKPNLEGR